MGSSARFTLVLLLIFVLGTALLLDNKDKKKDTDKDKEQRIALDARGPGVPVYATDTPAIGTRFDPEGPLAGHQETGGRSPPARVDYDQQTGEVRVPPVARPVAPSAPMPVGSRTATVQAGDSWWRVAKRELGSAKHINDLRRANPGVEMLQPGQALVIPAVGEVAPSQPVATRQPTASVAVRDPSPPASAGASSRLPRTHVVREGETLWVIARLHYGKGSLWYLIADRNGLTDTDRLKTGMKVEIPSPSSH